MQLHWAAGMAADSQSSYGRVFGWEGIWTAVSYCQHFCFLPFFLLWIFSPLSRCLPFFYVTAFILKFCRSIFFLSFQSLCHPAALTEFYRVMCASLWVKQGQYFFSWSGFERRETVFTGWCNQRACLNQSRGEQMGLVIMHEKPR